MPVPDRSYLFRNPDLALLDEECRIAMENFNIQKAPKEKRRGQLAVVETDENRLVAFWKKLANTVGNCDSVLCRSFVEFMQPFGSAGYEDVYQSCCRFVKSINPDILEEVEVAALIRIIVCIHRLSRPGSDIKILVDTLVLLALHESKEIRTDAQTLLRFLCKSTATNLGDVQLNYPRVARIVAQKLLASRARTETIVQIAAESEMCQHVGILTTIESWLKVTDMGACIISQILLGQESSAVIALQELAKFLRVPTVQILLVRTADKVFPLLVLDSPSDEDMIRGVALLEKLGGRKVRTMPFEKASAAINELIGHFEDKRERVIRGLEMLLTSRKRCRPDDENARINDIIKYLRPKFLGYIYGLEDAFHGFNPISEHERPGLLFSFARLMEILGDDNISQFRIKILSTLEEITEEVGPDILPACLKCWDAFLRNLDDHSAGSLLSHILVILLPYVKQYPKQVIPTFEYAIIERSASFRGHFRELFFIVRVPELQHLALKWQKAVSCGKIDEESFQRFLEEDMKLVDLREAAGATTRAVNFTQSAVVKQIRYPKPELKVLALRKLRNLINSHQTFFHKLVAEQVRGKITNFDLADEQVLKIVEIIMKGSLDVQSPTESTRYGELLGVLGAIDPERIEVTPEREELVVFRDVQTPDFAKFLMKELVKGYISSKGHLTHVYCFVTQRAMDFYKMKQTVNKDEDRIVETNDIWRSMSADCQEILRTFAFMQLKTGDTDYASTPYPIIANCSQSYTDWLRCWTTTMINSLKRMPVYPKLFDCCQIWIQWDPIKSYILLPNLFLLLLIHGSAKEAAAVDMEVKTILGCSKQLSDTLRYYGCQTILNMIEYIDLWISQGYHTESKNTTHRVLTWRKTITDRMIAEASFNCGASAKALRHFETHIREHDSQFVTWVGENAALSFMQSIFVALNEPDGVLGLHKLRKSAASLEDEIVFHKSNGDLNKAQQCYDMMLRKTDITVDPTAYLGLVRCYLDLEQPTAVLEMLRGRTEDDYDDNACDWINILSSYQAEAAWKLGSWDELNRVLNKKRESYPSTWNAGVGKLLSCARAGDSDCFREATAHLRAKLMEPICSMTGAEKLPFHQAYDHVVNLHVVQEIEDAAATWFNISLYPDEKDLKPKTTSMLLDEWKMRLLLMRPAESDIQKVLGVRRAVLEATGRQELQAEIGKCWLQSIRTARKFKRPQRVSTYLLHALPYNLVDLPIEQAKYHRMIDDRDQAIRILKDALMDPRYQQPQHLAILAKMKLTLARYLEEASSVLPDEMIQKYAEVVDLAPNIEKSHFYLGQYYDKILEAHPQKEHFGSQITLVVEQFVESLKYGCRYIHQTLPRLLSLWLDYGANGNNKEKREDLNAIHKIIKEAMKAIPPYCFLTVFSLLLSRMEIQNQAVFAVLSELIAIVTMQYPRQAMWHLIYMKMSRNQTRQERYRQIVNLIRSSCDGRLSHFISIMEEFTQHLIAICQWEVGNEKKNWNLSQYKNKKGLENVFMKMNEYRPIVPFWEYMYPTLPFDGYSTEHSPYRSGLSEIQSIGGNFIVMSSIQRPKRLVFHDTAGCAHGVLAKNQDDLRKDARFMELSQLINQFLRDDAESRQRNLHLRAYTVVPLDEVTGLVEWVENVETMRAIMMSSYAVINNRGMPDGKLMDKHRSMQNSSVEDKQTVYRAMCQELPPVLHGWFERSFPDPTDWWKARLTYTRTMAVLSMVGYIMGLGDRHGENILIDKTTAEAFNIDFGVLFNKGLTLPWPELVPFRLTRNVVNGMGPLGVEGFFRRACEMTLQLVRKNKNAAMCVLKTFLHDPLVEWGSAKRSKNKENSTNSAMVQGAETVLRNIEFRINGHITQTADSLPLSVTGQVDYLIEEARSEVNLCRMWIGWGAYH